ncbi:hypothetical protein WME93_01295 [Sorangium sp. So ce1000]
MRRIASEDQEIDLLSPGQAEQLGGWMTGDDLDVCGRPIERARFNRAASPGHGPVAVGMHNASGRRGRYQPRPEAHEAELSVKSRDERFERPRAVELSEPAQSGSRRVGGIESDQDAQAALALQPIDQAIGALGDQYRDGRTPKYFFDAAPEQSLEPVPGAVRDHHQAGSAGARDLGEPDVSEPGDEPRLDPRSKLSQGVGLPTEHLALWIQQRVVFVADQEFGAELVDDVHEMELLAEPLGEGRGGPPGLLCRWRKVGVANDGHGLPRSSERCACPRGVPRMRARPLSKRPNSHPVRRRDCVSSAMSLDIRAGDVQG